MAHRLSCVLTEDMPHLGPEWIAGAHVLVDTVANTVDLVIRRDLNLYRYAIVGAMGVGILKPIVPRSPAELAAAVGCDVQWADSPPPPPHQMTAGSPRHPLVRGPIRLE